MDIGSHIVFIVGPTKVGTLESHVRSSYKPASATSFVTYDCMLRGVSQADQVSQSCRVDCCQASNAGPNGLQGAFILNLQALPIRTSSFEGHHSGSK